MDEKMFNDLFIGKKSGSCMLIKDYSMSDLYLIYVVEAFIILFEQPSVNTSIHSLACCSTYTFVFFAMNFSHNIIQIHNNVMSD